eukprot:CAMPEP_0197028078 /NCGR_PEP_ID=MMETSP1384-20130603/7865_1 /TAXON_ID=29189 /ORGANISM="Ammonia sp." /LENGTH=666 /DNA_ID=CAMNT_0042457023 /DNA_START=110 /DNA_END=2110 /DNA_ORIENTATION=+
MIAFLTAWIEVEGLVRRTKYGRVEGVVEGGVQKYLKIPFAKPPVGDLRFAPPEEPEKWGGAIYDATGPLSSVPACPQGGTAYIPSNTEDCLYLNIFAPADADKNMTEKYPVMLWIHGGSFIQGGSSFFLYDYTNFVNEKQDVIVVTFNYRLGLLGWLYDNTFSTGVEGNFGYQDQKLVIEWVRSNIKFFGGDKTKITLIGHSAGAESVGLHLLYNNDNGKIAGGIMQSPSFQVPSRDPTTWNDVPERFSELVGCPTETDEQQASLLDCWRFVNVDTILSIQQDSAFSNGWPWAPVLFTPTTHTELIPNEPLFAFQDAPADSFKNVPPFIIGTTRDEMFWNYDAVTNAQVNYLGFNGLYYVLNLLVQDAATTVGILAQYGIYPSMTSLTGNWYYDLLELTTDNWYCAVRNVANNALSKMPEESVFYYNFDFANPTLNAYMTSNPTCLERACHGDDLPFSTTPPALLPLLQMFGVDSMGGAFQDLFANFARYGDPNGDGTQTTTAWPQYVASTGDDNFLRIDGNGQFVLQSTATDEPRPNTNDVSSSSDLCAFWDDMGYLYGANRVSYESKGNGAAFGVGGSSGSVVMINTFICVGILVLCIAICYGGYKVVKRRNKKALEIEQNAAGVVSSKQASQHNQADSDEVEMGDVKTVEMSVTEQGGQSEIV